MRTIVLWFLIASACLYMVGLAVINVQAIAYKFVQLSLILAFLHFVRKERWPYHDQESCSDLRALGMFIFEAIVVVAFMSGL
jgi:hypothetical protein